MAKVAIPVGQMEQGDLTDAQAEIRERMNDPREADGTPMTDAKITRRYIKAMLKELAMARHEKVAKASLVIPPLVDDTTD